MGKIEAIRHNVRGLVGTRGRHRIAPVHVEDVKAVFSRLSGALVRAFLVMMLVALPSVILPGVGDDAQQAVALIALFAGALTFAEYNAVYPSLVEFRDAPPFNRIRFVSLLVTVFCLSSALAAAEASSPMNRLFEALALLIGQTLDLPYSPVRLATLIMADGADGYQMMLLRAAAGLAYILSLMSLAFFVVILKLNAWPSRQQAFNVWVNLPTFEPTGGGDVVDRLERDARINISLGFLLPFLIPLVVRLVSSGIDPVTLSAPQTMIWTMTAWAFLPASLLMRGVAMGRIAAMIRSKRAANSGGPSARMATA